MPKRTSISEPARVNVLAKPTANRKTERSHEENQERAYIAASRRADRSLEARVQSARMASEIHKKRTGKSFRITEEVVVKEEMYEEEDDDLPRSYRLLGPHMQTASHEMNSKVDAYLTNKMAMSAYLAKSADDWRSNEINQLFARSFPNAGMQAHQLTQTVTGDNMYDDNTKQSPISPHFQEVNYHQSGATNHHGSVSSTSPRFDNTISPPPQTPGSDVHTNLSASTPSISTSTLTGPSDFGGAHSAFTAELPNDVKMMMMPGATDTSNPFMQGYYSQDWTGTDAYNNDPTTLQKMDMKADFDSNIYQDEIDPAMKWNTVPASNMEEPSWDNFINDSAWMGDHQ